jgi:hypothetical protein
MQQIKLCPECKAPEQITGDHLWLNSGVIVHKASQTSRMAFIECGNLDPLFKGIGEIIGMPIDHMVTDIARRTAAIYLSNQIPSHVRDAIRKQESGLDSIIDAMIVTSKLFGLGKYELVDIRTEGDEGDYNITRIAEPYSLLIGVGTIAGSRQALSGRPAAVSYKEVSPGVYDVKASAGELPEELEERMHFKEYHHRSGDIELEKCATCGGPKALSGFKWHLDRGVIINTHTTRRMALLGPANLDPIFDVLEEELGETIPRTVVEAQKRFVKSGFYSIEEVGDEGDFRTQLALRGLGDLQEIKIGAKGLHMHIDNAAVHLMIVGLAQGLFEMAFDVDSQVEWELSEEGDLEVAVVPRRIKDTAAL